jgi:hypothetical protein
MVGNSAVTVQKLAGAQLPATLLELALMVSASGAQPLCELQFCRGRFRPVCPQVSRL